MRLGRIAGFAAPMLLALATPARADDVDRCATAAEAAQRTRLAGKLREARDHLITCSSETCPAIVRRDCARWLTEVETELPTIVVRAREGGEDVADVRVFVDGERVAERVDGRPIPVDVGEHTLRFERPGLEAVSQRIITRSGEHARPVSVDFDPPEKPAAAPVGPLVLGGVGVALAAAGGVFWALGRGEHADLESTCAPAGTCATSDIDAARTKLVVGDVAVVAGVLALTGAVAWWLVGRPSSTRASGPPALVTF